MAFEKITKGLDKLTPNPAEKMIGVWHKGTPTRFVGCFTTPKYPAQIILPQRPISSAKNENAKKA